MTVCGTGSWTGPLPGDPDNNSILSATPAFGGIDVSWSYPGTNPHAVAHTLLYRGTSADFMTAIQRAVVAGNFFYDKLDTGTTYWYWIQIVSRNGTVGELIGPASATARPLIEDLIEQLTGQIDNGLLAISLKNTLDEIGTVNTNLINEIFDRETGETSFAAALLDVQNGVAEAHTFIATEIASRVSANEAIAEQINLVAVTLGSDIAAVTTSTTAWIDELEGTIGAMWTAQVTVNGLIGGFGILNDGTTVEAGFDVDTFWVGRTSANKRKPFIIVGSETFIDEAVINRLTFSKLRDEAGSFIVEDGQVKADYIDTKGLVIRDSAGNAVFSAGMGLDWDLITGSGAPADNATRNLVTSGTLAARPAGSNGDFYYATNTFTLYQKVSGAWVLASTVGAPSGTLVNGVAVATLTTAVTNFNASNDRNATAVVAPTILADGTAVDHTVRTNGSADISFEWVWGGDEGDIDGFRIHVYPAATSAAYVFGTTPELETVFELPANKRAFILFGVTPDQYYHFGVRAYRGVDKDVDATGTILSTLVKPSLAAENPYRPSSSVAFAGNVTGTVNGISAANVNVWSAISGAGRPDDNADVTSANTAAGIVGQGALATADYAFIGSTVKFADGSVMATGDFINKLSKITDVNIGTFMSAAAIGSAYIGNLAVKNAHIENLTVGTGKIANYAVTSPSGAQLASDLTGSSAATVLSVSVDNDSAPVWIFADFKMVLAGSGTATAVMNLWVNGVIVKSWDIVSDGPSSGGYIHATGLTASTVVVLSVERTGVSDVKAGSHLFAIGLKK